MTRKEEILSAARDYVSGITLSSPSNVLHFEAGAKWADNNPKNIWHPSYEEPEKYPILCQDEFGGTWEQYDLDLNDYPDGWKEFKEVELIVQWAYIEDLLPK